MECRLLHHNAIKVIPLFTPFILANDMSEFDNPSDSGTQTRTHGRVEPSATARGDPWLQPPAALHRRSTRNAKVDPRYVYQTLQEESAPGGVPGDNHCECRDEAVHWLTMNS